MSRETRMKPRLGYLTPDRTDLLPAEIAKLERQARVTAGMPSHYHGSWTAEDMQEEAERGAARDFERLALSMIGVEDAK